MAPPNPPKVNEIIASATDEKNGSDHGSRPIQSKSPVAPFTRPATSSDAITVKAVTKLGYRIAYVEIVCVSFQPALIPGSENWWWKPTGVDSKMKRTKTMRPSGSLNSRPPATVGSTE